MTHRKLIVCLDGTWNEPEQLEEGRPCATNVVKFCRALARLKGKQRKYYDEGVGTREWELLPGGIMGYGIDKRIMGAYRWLQQRFSDRSWQPEQNRIFIFGFSRGAYTARRLADLINYSGICADSNDSQLAWDVCVTRDTDRANEMKATGRFFDVAIEMVGVWDTVKSTNEPDFNDHQLSPNVKAGYHAMAIDERRTFFPVELWDTDDRARQVWFPGVHADVGGGYADCGLSDTALRWMIDRAREQGVKFKVNYVLGNIAPNSVDKLHNSYQGIWLPLGEKTRVIPDGSLVHVSAKERIEQSGYTPANLPPQIEYTDV